MECFGGCYFKIVIILWISSDIGDYKSFVCVVVLDVRSVRLGYSERSKFYHGWETTRRYDRLLCFF